MSGISLHIEGTKELIAALQKAERRFPASAEAILRKEARTAAKDIKIRIGQEAKGHGEKPGTLKKSFQPGKPIKRGNTYTDAVTTTAPHYHLYEEGHDLYDAYTGEWLAEVKGRKTVARYMAQRSEDSEKIGERLLDEILKDAGLE